MRIFYISISKSVHSSFIRNLNARSFNLLEKETETEGVVVGGFYFKAVLVIIKLEDTAIMVSKIWTGS